MLNVILRLARRARMLAGRAGRETAMDDEMRFHIEMEAADLRRRGLSPADAYAQARLAFGGVERFKEEGRDARGTRLLEDLWQDLGYAMRQLRAAPGFAAATILTLALGIGATTMMYSFRRYLTLQQIAIVAPERLMSVSQGPKSCADCRQIAAANVFTLRRETQTLDPLSMFAKWEPSLRGDQRTALLSGVRTTPDLFRTLGVRAMIGRTLAPGDTASGDERIVVLSETAWRTRFGADSGILGRPIVLDRKPYTVVGVVADANAYPRDAMFWTPLVLTPSEAAEQTRMLYRAVGRLRDGATSAMATAEIGALGARIAAAVPDTTDRQVLSARPMLDLGVTRDSANTTFDVAVVAVLLIACINLAGLLIARLAGRRREIAVRRALGAAPGRIIRQLLVETTLLTTLGGVVGTLVAWWGTRALVGWEQIHIDLHAFGVALATGMLSGALIALWPALRVARPALVGELREGASTDGARGRRALVATEIALAIVLLSAAGVLGRSLLEIYDVDAGFDTNHLLTVRIQNPPRESNDPANGNQVDDLLRSIAAVPGVEHVGATVALPYAHGFIRGTFEIAGRPPVPGKQRPRVALQPATPDYFRAIGIPVVRGRTFDDADREGAPRVAVLNRAAAERFFPGEDPVGRAVVIDSARWQIVGVVGNVFYGDVDELVTPEIYRPMRQWAGRSTIWIVARTQGDPARLAAPVAEAVRRFDQDIAITRLFTMRELRVNDTGSERMMLRVMGALAIAAMLISAIGLYGLISHSVARRTREFGVRLALGADASSIFALVLGEGLKLTAAGAVFGFAGALMALRAMRSLLFGVSPIDPITLGAVVGVTCVVAVVAAYLPARRATLVDPMRSLRQE